MYNENPHKLDEMRERERQRYIDNPELKDEMRKRERQRYIDNPELKDEMRIRGRQRFIDNPELKDEMRQRERNRITNKAGLRPGICKIKNGKFQVQIRIGDNKRLYLGQYITYEEALEVRLKAEDKFWGTNHLN
jgi:hypothetical protein